MGLTPTPNPFLSTVFRRHFPPSLCRGARFSPSIFSIWERERGVSASEGTRRTRCALGVAAGVFTSRKAVAPPAPYLPLARGRVILFLLSSRPFD
ncbi:hypothetical protein MLD38_005221 [Melastoma candidum]|uniref:Uncharacterized protein n=1 Tax=Melastoma candidum TaxID=119954 RepID=A0ACB9S9Q2_9MYRT|nr:hypothetical protein MLD38_005221 [Melastoma candidum]